ncbi:hypothetical protein [Rhizorhabdus sp.]|uniref:hypothetical protein n=1 Tax=Rhizorhabdus sp. TaxID=1968843 RepID=UPI0019A83598|nr:hypothetical protein [Rhizorhabdus sp.]MBD3762576.1 hypothetical protein [Rhizorhabdus sp.]
MEILKYSPSLMITIIGCGTILGTVLSHLVAAFVSRKKDAGDLASDMLTKAIRRIEKLEEEAAKCQASNLTLSMRCERNEFVSDLVIVELHARAPNSPVLAQAKALLARAFSVPRDMPADAAALLVESYRAEI